MTNPEVTSFAVVIWCQILTAAVVYDLMEVEIHITHVCIVILVVTSCNIPISLQHKLRLCFVCIILVNKK